MVLKYKLLQLLLLLAAARGIRCQSTSYFGKALGSFHHSDGLSGDIYVADPHTLMVINFKASGLGCKTFMAGPLNVSAFPRSLLDDSGVGIMLPLKHNLGDHSFTSSGAAASPLHFLWQQRVRRQMGDLMPHLNSINDFFNMQLEPSQEYENLFSTEKHQNASTTTTAPVPSSTTVRALEEKKTEPVNTKLFVSPNQSPNASFFASIGLNTSLSTSSLIWKARNKTTEKLVSSGSSTGLTSARKPGNLSQSALAINSSNDNQLQNWTSTEGLSRSFLPAVNASNITSASTSVTTTTSTVSTSTTEDRLAWRHSFFKTTLKPTSKSVHQWGRPAGNPPVISASAPSPIGPPSAGIQSPSASGFSLDSAPTEQSAFRKLKNDTNAEGLHIHFGAGPVTLPPVRKDLTYPAWFYELSRENLTTTIPPTTEPSATTTKLPTPPPWQHWVPTPPQAQAELQRSWRQEQISPRAHGFIVPAPPAFIPKPPAFESQSSSRQSIQSPQSSSFQQSGSVFNSKTGLWQQTELSGRQGSSALALETPWPENPNANFDRDSLGPPNAPLRFGPVYDLPKANGDGNVKLQLPEGYELRDFRWIGIYDHCKQEIEGNVDIPPNFLPPREAIVPGIHGQVFGTNSGDIHIVDCSTLLLRNFSFWGNQNNDAYFFVGYGEFPQGIIQKAQATILGVPPTKPLSIYHNQDIIVKLPTGWRTFDVDWISVLNPWAGHSYGHALLPRYAVPPCENLIS